MVRVPRFGRRPVRTGVPIVADKSGACREGENVIHRREPGGRVTHRQAGFHRPSDPVPGSAVVPHYPVSGRRRRAASAAPYPALQEISHQSDHRNNESDADNGGALPEEATARVVALPGLVAAEIIAAAQFFFGFDSGIFPGGTAALLVIMPAAELAFPHGFLRLRVAGSR